MEAKSASTYGSGNSIEELIGIEISGKKSDKQKKDSDKNEKLRKIAISFGFITDNYYTSIEKMNMHNLINTGFSDELGASLRRRK